MGDQDDKQWLYDNGHMTMSGGKVGLLTEKMSKRSLLEGYNKLDLPKFNMT